MKDFTVQIDGKTVVDVKEAPGGFIATNEHGGMVAVGTWSKIWPLVKKYLDKLTKE